MGDRCGYWCQACSVLLAQRGIGLDGIGSDRIENEGKNEVRNEVKLKLGIDRQITLRWRIENSQEGRVKAHPSSNVRVGVCLPACLPA